ncbi:MAG: hypothetical protein K2W92_02385 [Alphaproteobacteria bacterium]|nr:hypothetical protein [Burkholderiaceae bacterium]MBY0292118.1 hypothetical protein [Alphaproteobacteria bacterium]
MSITEVFVAVATISAAIFSGALLWMIRKPKIPKWLDVAASIMLLVFAALCLGMLQTIYNDLPGYTVKQKDLKAQYQIALYLVPFFTAGLATNILAHVILADRDYTGTITFYDAAIKSLQAICFVALALTIFGLMGYVAYKKLNPTKNVGKSK